MKKQVSIVAVVVSLTVALVWAPPVRANVAEWTMGADCLDIRLDAVAIGDERMLAVDIEARCPGLLGMDVKVHASVDGQVRASHHLTSGESQLLLPVGRSAGSEACIEVRGSADISGTQGIVRVSIDQRACKVALAPAGAQAGGGLSRSPDKHSPHPVSVTVPSLGLRQAARLVRVQ